MSYNNLSKNNLIKKFNKSVRTIKTNLQLEDNDFISNTCIPNYGTYNKYKNDTDTKLINKLY